MSLILDALKKSEQKRQLGQAPTLGSPVIPVRQRRNTLPVLLIVIALVAVGGWWFVYRPAGTPAPTAPAAKPATGNPPAAAPAIAAGARPASATPTPAAAPAVAAAAPAVAATANSRAPTAMAAAPSRAPTPNAAAPAARAGPPVTAGAGRRPAPRPLSDVPDAGTAAAAATPAAPPGALPATTSAPRGAAASAAAPAAGAAAPATAAASAPATPAPEPRGVPTYYDLAFPMRKDLPALKISMHVYAPEPAQRFIVINGAHEGEGDSIEGGVTVREIRPTDVVLEFQGKQFSVPRNGI